jgi:hypothetical protein
MHSTHRGEQGSAFFASWRQPSSIFHAICSCESNKDYYSAIEVVEQTLEREAQNGPEMVGKSLARPSQSVEDEARLRALAQLPSLEEYDVQGFPASK